MWSLKNKGWQKKSGTYTKPADPKINPKETLTYSMSYKAQILLDVTTDIACR